MRVFARRERPHPGAQLTLFEAEDGWRYTLWVSNLPERTPGCRGGRRRKLQIAGNWPWADAIVTAWARISALPQAP